MSKFTQTLCILFAFVSLFSNATGSRPQPALRYALAPENQPSCDSFELNMNDCSPYLKKDSIIAEPSTSCCSEVMNAWKVDSKCAGEVLKGIVNLRNMNETRATHVSSTCEASLLEARLSADKAKAPGWNVAIFVLIAVFLTVLFFNLYSPSLLIIRRSTQLSFLIMCLICRSIGFNGMCNATNSNCSS